MQGIRGRNFILHIVRKFVNNEATTPMAYRILKISNRAGITGQLHVGAPLYILFSYLS